jgi:hypothetical protein
VRGQLQDGPHGHVPQHSHLSHPTFIETSILQPTQQPQVHETSHLHVPAIHLHSFDPSLHEQPHVHELFSQKQTDIAMNEMK